MSKPFSLLFSVLIALLFNGCAALDPPNRSLKQIDLPSSYGYGQNSTLKEAKTKLSSWWKAFESKELNHLVDTVLKGNLDIRSAWARLKQAQALVDKSKAGLFPTLDTSLKSSRTRTYIDNELITDSKSTTLDLSAAYEFDLWGKISSEHKASLLSAEAALQDVQAAAISLVGNVVNTWIELLVLRQEIGLLKKQIKINQDLLRLQKIRLEKGLGTAPDLSNQQELLSSYKAELPNLQAQKDLNLNKLALLVGRGDGNELSIQQNNLPKPIPCPDAGVPAELLIYRPDVKAAFLRLRSSDWEVKVAKANRLPSLSISAQTGLSSQSFSLNWGDWLTNLGANLGSPLFDAGLRKAEQIRAEATSQEYLAKYSLTVLEAIKEVRDALASEARQEEKIQRIREELKAAEKRKKQARLRYLNGQDNYLNFLITKRSLLSLKRKLITAKADLLNYRVALYRSLGANWKKDELKSWNK